METLYRLTTWTDVNGEIRHALVPAGERIEVVVSSLPSSYPEKLAEHEKFFIVKIVESGSIDYGNHKYTLKVEPLTGLECVPRGWKRLKF